ncbi:MAG TPA: hypothetical protein VKH15_02455 [Candidatus Acidoferrum sp.]|jgi:putative Mn2+ efflux pump MntP|nr:hypothetical protein [Candidatus Acidoferrum sp.]
MATTQPAGSKERGYLAKSFVILGLAFLLADFAFLAPSFEQLMESSSHGLDSLVPAIGLSLLHTAGAIALHQVDYVPLVSRILVLFSALALMAIGAVLWGRRPGQTVPRDAQIYIVSFGGDN